MEQQRSELQSGSVSESSGTGKVFVFNCPYLGTLEDADTSLAYPASANHCFRLDSPSAVDLAHQEALLFNRSAPGLPRFSDGRCGNRRCRSDGCDGRARKTQAEGWSLRFPLNSDLDFTGGYHLVACPRNNHRAIVGAGRAER